MLALAIEHICTTRRMLCEFRRDVQAEVDFNGITHDLRHMFHVLDYVEAMRKVQFIDRRIEIKTVAGRRLVIE